MLKRRHISNDFTEAIVGDHQTGKDYKDMSDMSKKKKFKSKQ